MSSCEGRRGRNERFRCYVSGAKPPEGYVAGSRLGPCLSICYEDQVPCSWCGKAMMIPKLHKPRFEAGDKPLCHVCYQYPGLREGWEVTE